MLRNFHADVGCESVSVVIPKEPKTLGFTAICGGQPENNFARSNRPRRANVELTAPGGAPQPPTPHHPARDPGPLLARRVFLYGTIVENPP
jgi:hypothetical protein